MSIMDVFVEVMKADEAAGCAFIDSVVYDWMADEGEYVRKDLTAMYSIVHLDRIQSAKRQLGRGYVSKMVEGEYPDDSFQVAAEWLAGLEEYVTKALGWESWSRGGANQNVQVNRDSRGRFARGINIQQTSSITQAFNSQDPESASVHPLVRREVLNTDAARADADVNNQQMQAQWEQANEIVGQMQDVFRNAEAKDIDIEMQLMRENGNQRIMRVNLADAKDGLPDSAAWKKGEALISMEVSPSPKASPKTVSAVASYNTLGETGGPALASLMSVDSNRAKELRESLGMDYKPNATGLNRFFGRMQSGGSVLSQVQGGEKLGRMAELVGTLGPQAEEVLGPYAQRAAYRYRGTETTPSKQLLQAFNSPDMGAVNAGMEAPDNPVTPIERIAAVNAASDRVMIRDNVVAGQGLSGDSLKMAVRADVASAELVDSLPKDPILASLSEASGDVLPSQGILIDADGKVVSQSVGFADDHYLPFDLKNLGSLRGGQYARTRQAGGLTGEDVYAAVTMGARQVQVLSPSGVFTLEMQPDFRGARGNSDKAKGMYDRYLKILDAVENSGLYLQDISGADKAKIRRQVAEMGYKDTEAEDMVARRIDEARRDQTMLTEEDEAAARESVMREMNLTSEGQIKGSVARTFEATLDDKLEGIRAQKANRLRLNGEGYAVALQTLQQQFPYFIRRVGYRSLNDFATVTGTRAPKGRTFAEDSGYTRPGALRPTTARSGYFEPGSLEVRGKETTRQKERRLAAEKESKATAAATPAETNPDGTPKAPEDTTPKTGVEARAAAMSPVLEKQQQDAIALLASNLGGAAFLDPARDVNQRPGFAQIAMADDSAAAWLLTATQPELAQVLADKQTALRAAVLLSSRPLMERAVSSTMSTMAPKDFFSGGGQIGGQNNAAAAAKWIKEQAQVVADTIIMQYPFTLGNDPWYGTKKGEPAITAQRFEGIKDIKDKKQLEGYGSSNKSAWNDAIDLMNDGDDYRMLGEIAADATARLKGLKAVDTVKRKLAEPNTSDTDIRDAIAIAGGDPVLKLGLETAARHNPDIDSDIAESWPNKDALAAEIGKVRPEEEARALQRAWSLAFTARLIQAFDEGDAVPKGPARWLRSSVTKAHPQIVVLSKADPLSRAVARRAAAGLPFVPTATGRYRT